MDKTLKEVKILPEIKAGLVTIMNKNDVLVSEAVTVGSSKLTMENHNKKNENHLPSSRLYISLENYSLLVVQVYTNDIFYSLKS